jgi:hypothetical protein
MKAIFSHLRKKNDPWTQIQNTLEDAGIENEKINPFFTSENYGSAADKKNTLALQNLYKDQFEKKEVSKSSHSKKTENDEKLDSKSFDSTETLVDKKQDDLEEKNLSETSSTHSSENPPDKRLSVLKDLTGKGEELPIVSTIKYFARLSSLRAFVRQITRDTSALFLKQVLPKLGNKPILFEVPLITSEKSVVILKAATRIQGERLFNKAKEYNLERY